MLDDRGKADAEGLQASDLPRILRYEPETGKLYWRERGPEWFQAAREHRRWNTRYAGKAVYGNDNGAGHLFFRIRGAKLYVHRVAWLLTFGEWPPAVIDHINGDPSDNRIVNLRAATHRENIRNQAKRLDNTSGFKGVHLFARTGRWQAYITTNGKRKHLGYFSDPESAHAAYVAAAERLHGEFARAA